MNFTSEHHKLVLEKIDACFQSLYDMEEYKLNTPQLCSYLIWAGARLAYSCAPNIEEADSVIQDTVRAAKADHKQCMEDEAENGCNHS